MTYVIRISKPTKNVLTVTDKRDLIFDSANNVLKVRYTGTLSVTVNYVDDGFGFPIGEAENFFTHGLGYVPLAFCFLSDIGMQLPHFINVGAGTAVSYSYRMDNSKLYISVSDSGVNGGIGDQVVYDFTYQIMGDKII